MKLIEESELKELLYLKRLAYYGGYYFPKREVKRLLASIDKNCAAVYIEEELKNYETANT